MSGSKAARNTAAITNRCQGGGDKLSGLAPSINRLPANLSAYNRAVHITPTRKAFVLGRDIMGAANNPCAKPGCKCDAFSTASLVRTTSYAEWLSHLTRTPLTVVYTLLAGLKTVAT